MTQMIDILMVEDSPSDAKLTQLGLQDMTVPHQVHLVTDGEQALFFLRRKGQHHAAPRPDLVLLDLNLPRVHGREVLAEIKQDPDLRRIPVVIFSSSAAERDIAQSYDLHANSYVVKPLDYQGLQEMVQTIERYWMSLVALPPA